MYVHEYDMKLHIIFISYSAMDIYEYDVNGYISCNAMDIYEYDMEQWIYMNML